MQLPEKGERVRVIGFGVTGTVESITEDGVIIRQDNGGERYFGNFYFDQLVSTTKPSEEEG